MRPHVPTLATIAILATAAPASAQVLQRRFDTERNGPWTVVDLGRQDRDETTYDPRGFAVGEDGAVHTVCKVPVEGPPTGGGVVRVDRGDAEPIGGDLGDDPAAILAADGALYVAGKGFATQPARVLRLDGGAWVPAHDGSLESEMRGLAIHDGALHVATKSDGVYRLDGTELIRVGATTNVLPDGYAWGAVGDYAADVHEGALLPDGSLVVVGKDQRVRQWDGEAWADLGNLTEATWDPNGVPLTFLREPKSVAVGADGTIYVGTKGMEGSAEGKDRGAVWRWNGTGWDRIGTTDMRKEVKRVVVLDGGVLLAGTNETGVFRWNGETWTAINVGLPADGAGKIKGDRLFLAADGQLYVAIVNAVYRRGTGADGAWTEVGFFATGEEITSVGVVDGDLHVGCKVGEAAGAVYVQDDANWIQLGDDLPRDVKQLTWSPSGDMYAVLGAGAGTFRWTGTAWEGVLGNLTGDASDFKQLLLPTDVDLYGISKLGVQRGAYQTEPIEIIDFALKNRAVSSLAAAGGHLWAVTETDGVFRRATSETSDDGLDWITATAGLPDVELRGVVAVGDRVYVIGKFLLYEGSVDSEGVLDVLAFGTNPGKAALDGNGEIIFTGETELTAIAEHDGRIFLGTKDGLFVSRDGQSWELYNGPAEVKALAVVGDLLYVAVKAKEVPDANEPTTEVHSAQVWIKDLAADPDDDPIDEPGGCGCASSSGGAGVALPLVLGLGIAIFWPFRRRGLAPPAKKPNNRLLGWSRFLHTWSGVLLGVVILVEGCTGIFLLHEDDLKGMAEWRVPSWMLPSRYDAKTGPGRKAEQIAQDPTDPNRLLAGSKDAVVMSTDGGATWSPVGARSAFDKIHAIAFGAGSIWIGHHDGLAACDRGGETCRAVSLGDGDREVRAIAWREGTLLIAIHRRGVLASDDEGASWRELTASLWADPRARDPKGEVHAHGLAVDGDALVVATSAGLFRSTESGEWRPAGLAGLELEQVVVASDGAIWVTPGEDADSALLVSRDRGIAWDEVPLEDAHHVRLAPAPHNTGAVLLVDKRGAVLATAAERVAAPWSLPTVRASAGSPGGAPLGKVLNDLHTGKFFGGALWLVYDLAAIAMMLFVVTGFHLWITPYLVRRRKRQRLGAAAEKAPSAP